MQHLQLAVYTVINFLFLSVLGMLNDLWKFDGTNWTWISGSNQINQPGNYGIKGVPHPDNVPGGRQYAAAWIDSSDNLLLFGGYDNSTGNYLATYC